MHPATTSLHSVMLVVLCCLATVYFSNKVRAQAAEIEEVYVVSDYIPDEKLETSEVADLLDADTMSIAGDSDLGAALKRVPGLSLVGGRFIYVRGLGERYSSTYVNGTPMPSPEPLQRAVPLDMFDTAVVKNVLVQKTHSANYGIEFSGGVVDIRTAAIPVDPFFHLKVGTSYNDISTGKRSLSYDGGGRDWLGYDDGTRDLPALIEANRPNYKRTFIRGSVVSGFEQDALALSFDNNWVLEEQSNPYDWSYSMAGGKRYSLNDRIAAGFIASASLSNEWRNRYRHITRYDYLDVARQDDSERTALLTDVDSLRHQALDSPEPIDGILRVRDRDTTLRTVNSNLLLSAGAEIDTLHTLILTMMQARKSSDLAAVNREADLFEERLFQQEQLIWVENEILFKQLSGMHYLDFGELNWRYSDIDASRDTPDSRVSERNIQNGEEVFAGTSDPTRSWTSLADSTTEYGFDLSVPFYRNASFLPELTLTFGYARFEQERVFDSYQYIFDMNLLAQDATAARLPLEVLTDSSSCDVGQSAIAGDSCYLYTGATTTGNNQLAGHINLEEGFFSDADTPEGFVGTFETEAVYVLWDLHIFENLRMTMGVRNERSSKELINPLSGEVLLSAADQDDFDNGRKTLSDLISSPSERFQLSSSSLTWDFYPNMILRAAYSETVNRPILRELSPLEFYNPDEDETYFGNTNLQIATIYNSDLRYEWYYGDDNYLGITYFRKKINRPIEIEETDSEDPKLTWVNLKEAENEGIEFEVRQYLTPFIVLSANATLIDSTVIDDRFDAPVFSGDRPMQGLSDELYNVQLVYQDDVFTVSLAYNYFSERLDSIRSADGKNKHAVYEQPFQSLDFNFKSALYTGSGKFDIGFKVKNILNEKAEGLAALLAPSTEAQRDSALADFRLPYEVYNVGITYALSLSWKQ